LDSKEKYVPQKANDLIYGNSTYGPTFVGGHDVYLSDKCNMNASSYAYFPNTYNKEGKNKYAATQDTYKLFCGAKSGNYFKVIEY